VGWTGIVCFHQIDLGEEGTTEKLVRVVIDMPVGVAVRDGPGVECSVVAARAPLVALLEHDM
jgi:hypothetical protein